MADFGNLLGNLEEEEQAEILQEEYEEEDVFDKEANSPSDKDRNGRPSMGTEATEPMMSEDWGETPTSTLTSNYTPTAEVPAALQEAKRRLADADDDEEAEVLQGGKALFATEGIDQEEEQEGQMQLNQVYAKLHECWSQEKYSPEILDYDEEMVTTIGAQIQARQDWIDQVTEDSSSSNAPQSMGETSVQTLLVTLAQVDLDRVKFVLANWLGTRLAKIEAHPLHMRDKVDSLSPSELAYLKEYGMMLEDHLRRTVLDHIPEAWQALDEGHMIDTPNYSQYHFWMVQERIDAEGDQEEGTCLVAKYKDMRDFMRQGKVELQL